MICTLFVNEMNFYSCLISISTYLFNQVVIETCLHITLLDRNSSFLIQICFFSTFCALNLSNRINITFFSSKLFVDSISCLIFAAEIRNNIWLFNAFILFSYSSWCFWCKIRGEEDCVIINVCEYTENLSHHNGERFF